MRERHRVDSGACGRANAVERDRHLENARGGKWHQLPVIVRPVGASGGVGGGAPAQPMRVRPGTSSATEIGHGCFTRVMGHESRGTRSALTWSIMLFFGAAGGGAAGGGGGGADG